MSKDSRQIKPRLLKGFRDTLPHQLQIRNKLINTISEAVSKFGFQPLETPSLEYSEILQGKLGDEGEKLLYKFIDHGGREVAMRYDFTIPLARVAAQYPELTKPFKRYQVGPVWRADNTQRGRYREFYQFDLDIVGSNSYLSDAEILALMQDILNSLGVTKFKIRVNDRNIMLGIAKQLALDTHQQKTFFAGIDKLDKVGAEGVLQFWENHGLNQFSESFFNTQLVELADKLKDQSQIDTIIESAIELGLDKNNIDIDFSIVRGLDYYTGLVFETTLLDAPEFGSIFSGGRYDNLIGRFASQHIPAVGASVGLDRLIAAMESLNILPEPNRPSTVFVTIFNDDLQTYSLEVVRRLRSANIITEISFISGNLGKQLKTASAKEMSYAIIAGPDEAQQNVIVLRNLINGNEHKLEIDEAIKVIKSEAV